MGIKLSQGRFFADSDGGRGTRAAILDQSIAEMFWPDENPIGKRVATGDGRNPDWSTVVGVVGHVASCSMAPPRNRNDDRLSNSTVVSTQLTFQICQSASQLDLPFAARREVRITV
ncbi:MAG: ABC transporter permease [Acidobacteriota bacterium]